jgi:peptidoglycan DL-endopeptidase CwlO
VAGSVVTVLACSAAPLARPAGADPLSSDRAQAAAAAAQLQADSDRLDALSQQYELAQQQVSTIDGQIQQVRGAVAKDQTQVSTDESGLRSQALQSYESDSADSGLDGVFGPGGVQAAESDVYKTLAAGNLTNAVDDLRLAEDHLSQQQAELQSSETQAQSALDRAAAARNAAESVANAESSTVHSLNAQISTLLAQQQAAAEAAAHQRYLASLGTTPSIGAAPTGVGAGAGATSAPPPNGAGGAAVQAAESQIGVPYVWGAEDPGHGFDCSGLAQWAWGQAGVGLPRTADAQYQATAHVPLSDLEPGDLVFWGSGGYAEHVGIYVGGGEVVDAPSTGQDVQIQPIWPNGLLGAGRP